MPLCFFYDIFWVFISPYIFQGESVMVEVGFDVMGKKHGTACEEGQEMEKISTLLILFFCCLYEG